MRDEFHKDTVAYKHVPAITETHATIQVLLEMFPKRVIMRTIELRIVQNIRGLNLAEVKHTTVQVSRLTM
jgi:hypothetical protein